MSHHCHAAGCQTNVPPKMLMCRKHWSMVPRSIQSQVWATYREGQCDDWEISHEYANAACAAVLAVAKKENQPQSVIEKALRVYKMLDPGPTPMKEERDLLSDW